MSYDLYFLVRSGTPPVSWERFKTWFSNRPNYEIKEHQAFYGSEDSGCHFWFEWDDSSASDPERQPDNDLQPASASFEMNYNRPFWFANEAEPEVRAFVDAFGLAVEDPQASGMGRGDYSSAGFIDGWRAGNRFGISVMSGDQHRSAPEAHVVGAAAWNRSVRGLQVRSGDDVFVPRAVWVEVNVRLERMVTWWTDVPTLVPDVELVVLGRESPSLFSRLRGAGQSSAVLPLAAIVDSLSEWQEDPESGRWRTTRSSADVDRLFRGAPTFESAGLEIVPSWEVFEAEELAKIKPVRAPRLDDLPPNAQTRVIGDVTVMMIPDDPSARWPDE